MLFTNLSNLLLAVALVSATPTLWIGNTLDLSVWNILHLPYTLAYSLADNIAQKRDGCFDYHHQCTVAECIAKTCAQYTPPTSTDCQQKCLANPSTYKCEKTCCVVSKIPTFPPCMANMTGRPGVDGVVVTPPFVRWEMYRRCEEGGLVDGLCGRSCGRRCGFGSG